jgi:hypothetical protein
MKAANTQAIIFKKIIGIISLALAITGAVSLTMKEIPLALFGERSTGVVKKVEKITTSSGSNGQIRNGVRVGKKYGSELTFLYLDFTTKAGKAMEVKTLATFNTEAKVGDTHPMIYLSSKPETAKIYSAKQLWLPMCAGFVFVTVCLLIGLRCMSRKPFFPR